MLWGQITHSFPSASRCGSWWTVCMSRTVTTAWSSIGSVSWSERGEQSACRSDGRAGGAVDPTPACQTQAAKHHHRLPVKQHVQQLDAFSAAAPQIRYVRVSWQIWSRTSTVWQQICWKCAPSSCSVLHADCFLFSVSMQEINTLLQFYYSKELYVIHPISFKLWI